MSIKLMNKCYVAHLNYYIHLHVCPSMCPAALVTLQRFIPLIAPEAPIALVPGAPEPRMYPLSTLVFLVIFSQTFCQFPQKLLLLLICFIPHLKALT